MNNPTYSKELAECIASGQVSAEQVEAHDRAGDLVKVSQATSDFKRMDFGVTDAFVPIALCAGPSGELAQWFQGPLPDIGDECSYVCIGRTPTSVSMAWVTRQHLDSLKATK